MKSTCVTEPKKNVEVLNDVYISFFCAFVDIKFTPKVKMILISIIRYSICKIPQGYGSN